MSQSSSTSSASVIKSTAPGTTSIQSSINNNKNNKTSRILVLSVAEDTSSEYISLMNTFFAAQKLNVPIDVCKLFQKSVFLPQGCHITGGIFMEAQDKPSLLQTLIFNCLSDQNMREVLAIGSSEHSDYRSTCFCHRKVVDTGFVCSLCLSVLCSYTSSCPICHHEVDMFK